jgi:hypothetical protein
MKDKFAADSVLETSCAQIISRREGLKLSAASILASLLPPVALTATRTASPRSTKLEEHTMAQMTATQQASAHAADKPPFVRFE